MKAYRDSKLSKIVNAVAILSLTLIGLGLSVGIFQSFPLTWASVTLCAVLWLVYSVIVALAYGD